MAPLRSAGTVVGIVLALAGAEPQPLGQRRALRLQFGVGVECRLVLPQFEQDQLVGIGDAPERLELFAASILSRDLAARFHRLREFGALAGRRIEVTTSRTAMDFLPYLKLYQPVS